MPVTSDTLRVWTTSLAVEMMISKQFCFVHTDKCNRPPQLRPNPGSESSEPVMLVGRTKLPREWKLYPVLSEYHPQASTGFKTLRPI